MADSVWSLEVISISCIFSTHLQLHFSHLKNIKQIYMISLSNIITVICYSYSLYKIWNRVKYGYVRWLPIR